MPVNGLGEISLIWRVLLRLFAGRHALISAWYIGCCGISAGLDSWHCGTGDPAQVTPAALSRRPPVRLVQA